jgi:hypothetical protein
MSHQKLSFDLFTSTSIKEGFNENQNISGASNKQSYLDEFAALQKNEQLMIKYTTDFVERATASKYCKIINDIGYTVDAKGNRTPFNGDDRKFYVTNQYVTGTNQKTTIDKNNKATYLAADKCGAITTWANQNATGTYNSSYFATNYFNNYTYNDASMNSFYTDISGHFGNNIVTDLSYINALTLASNSLITDLSSYSANSNTDVSWNVALQRNINQYNKNIELRSKLDLAMNDLYSGDQSIAMYQKKSLDSVVYANILWTILATSLVYYVFVKL